MAKHERLYETPVCTGSPQCTPGVFQSSQSLWRLRPRHSSRLERDVTRTVERRAASVWSKLEDQRLLTTGKTVESPGLGRMRFESSFQHLDYLGLPMWKARARLIGKGPRVGHCTRVEVELSPWSRTATQLRVTPRSSHVGYWSPRRSKRYFLLAHGAAKVLVEMVLAGELVEAPAPAKVGKGAPGRARHVQSQPNVAG